MKRVLAALLAVLMLTLCGCSTVVLGNGTLEIDANNVDHIVISNGRTGKTFSVADRETIETIVNHIKSYELNDPQETWNGNAYNLNLEDVKGDTLLYFAVNESSIIVNDTGYYLNAKDLLRFVESLECDTLTDNELIDALLNGNTLEQLNIVDEEGKISVDMIINLPKNCPALFELLSRPTAIASVSGYGADRIGEFLNSTNPQLVEKAQEWIKILEKLMPEIREKLEGLLKQ